MIEVIKCIETGMATIMIKSGTGQFKLDILADELAYAIDLAQRREYETLKEYFATFNSEIKNVDIKDVAKALVNPAPFEGAG